MPLSHLRPLQFAAVLALLVLWPAFAGACSIQRPEISDPIQSFKLYIQSERQCGVHKDALPYILKANKNMPFRGTVVLVHGLTANPMHVRQIANYLQAHGYNVVAPILEGHGGSDSFLATATLQKWQKDVKYAGDIAEKLGRPLFIGGHSTGGLMAALEAARDPSKYSAIFGLDPAMNLSGVIASKARYACYAAPGTLGSYVATYETDRIPELFTGQPHKSLREQVEDVRQATAKLVHQDCGAHFPIPRYNIHYTLAGICALSQGVKEMKSVPPNRLPPTLMLESKDPDFYGPDVSKKQLVSYVKQIPDHEIVQTQAPSHELMPGACSSDFDSTLSDIKNWLNSYGKSQMVQETPSTVTQ